MANKNQQGLNFYNGNMWDKLTYPARSMGKSIAHKGNQIINGTALTPGLGSKVNDFKNNIKSSNSKTEPSIKTVYFLYHKGMWFFYDYKGEAFNEPMNYHAIKTSGYTEGYVKVYKDGLIYVIETIKQQKNHKPNMLKELENREKQAAKTLKKFM